MIHNSIQRINWSELLDSVGGSHHPSGRGRDRDRAGIVSYSGQGHRTTAVALHSPRTTILRIADGNRRISGNIDRHHHVIAVTSAGACSRHTIDNTVSLHSDEDIAEYIAHGRAE